MKSSSRNTASDLGSYLYKASTEDKDEPNIVLVAGQSRWRKILSDGFYLCASPGKKPQKQLQDLAGYAISSTAIVNEEVYIYLESPEKWRAYYLESSSRELGGIGQYASPEAAASCRCADLGSL